MKIARKLNPRKFKLAKAIDDRSALSAYIHTVLHTQNLPNLLSLSAEIHEVPALHSFIVLFSLWIVLPTSITNYKAFCLTRERGKNQPQCESAKIYPARVLILAKARKNTPAKKGSLQYWLETSFIRILTVITPCYFCLWCGLKCIHNLPQPLNMQSMCWPTSLQSSWERLCWRRYLIDSANWLNESEDMWRFKLQEICAIRPPMITV